MKEPEKMTELGVSDLGAVSGGSVPLGVYRPGFLHKEESLRFFKERVGEEVYNRAMNSDAGRAHHYSVARVFLDQRDWEKFVWIEEYGSLDGFPGN